MAILAVAKDLKDMRERMGKIVVAYDRSGKAITTEDLQVAGAMTAWMNEALNPNLLQSLEGQPVFVHAGPFANIAIGQSSILADRVALKLSDYHVTESGFGADIGFEKFWNLKCRFSGLKPHCAVVVATIRALKCHGGAPIPVPGKPMPAEYEGENVEWVEKGCANLLHHIETVKKAGINPVVCVNSFYTDTDNEIAAVKRLAEAAGARVAVSRHWEKGGEVAIEFAEAVQGRLRRRERIQAALRSGDSAAQAHRPDRQGSLRRRRRGLQPRGRSQGQEDRGRCRAVQAGHLHGQDSPVADRQPRPQGRAPRTGVCSSATS